MVKGVVRARNLVEQWDCRGIGKGWNRGFVGKSVGVVVEGTDGRIQCRDFRVPLCAGLD